MKSAVFIVVIKEISICLILPLPLWQKIILPVPGR